MRVSAKSMPKVRLEIESVILEIRKCDIRD